MVWLEYQKSDGYVVKIYDVEPTKDANGVYIDIPVTNGIFASNSFNVNDEFVYAIYIHLDEYGNPNGLHSAIQQAPVATHLLNQLAEKDAKIGELEQVIADLSELLIDQGVI